MLTSISALTIKGPGRLECRRNVITSRLHHSTHRTVGPIPSPTKLHQFLTSNFSVSARTDRQTDRLKQGQTLLKQHPFSIAGAHVTRDRFVKLFQQSICRPPPFVPPHLLTSLLPILSLTVLFCCEAATRKNNTACAAFHVKSCTFRRYKFTGILCL